MAKCIEIAALYIAALKAISLIHRHNHWLTNGPTFFGDHLLFERIYKSAQESLDAAAEKFIGVLGDKCLDYDLRNTLLHKALAKYSNLEGSPARMSMAAEKDFVAYSKVAYNAFEEEGCMTLGMDDLIMSIASDREEAIYLLKQRLEDGN